MKKNSKKRLDVSKKNLRNTRYILCINSKTRILKKWMDENEK